MVLLSMVTAPEVPEIPPPEGQTLGLLVEALFPLSVLLLIVIRSCDCSAQENPRRLQGTVRSTSRNHVCFGERDYAPEPEQRAEQDDSLGAQRLRHLPQARD